MNDWNQLESRLSSWRPRRPSSALKKKLFPAAAEETRSYIEAHLWRLLAPGFALFLGLCMLNTRNNQTFTPFISPTTGMVAAVALSHPQLASYCDSSFTEHNIWPTTSFEWTNRSRALTSAAPVADTNRVIP